MNTRFLLAICSVAALASCSTSYKAQTPDDVYFSPPKPGASYVKSETKEQPSDAYRYNDYYSSEDAYLRWKVRDPLRWSAFDNYDYSTYGYGYGSPVVYGAYGYQPWGSYWNSYWTWNSHYNPYCNRGIVVNPKTNATVFNKIRTYTPGTYNNTTYNNTNGTRGVKLTQGSYSPGRSYNNGNSSLGSSIKKIFSNSGSSYSPGSSDSRPSRTFTPSSSGGSSGGGRSSGGSSGGGGGSVGRPGRGG
jgi:hypothetical protein